ncbi:MAG: winged helix-turn-helix transcriptional regulator, partial [Rhodospirillales bacterium]|nr:winged helix-turn-helix transcriptional regulator [Rhodospirillales bacterium]
MSADPADLARAVAVLRTLANPTRLRIVMHLLQGEAAVSQIEQALGLRQPNLSQQLAELRDAGVVTSRREAKSVIYAL